MPQTADEHIVVAVGAIVLRDGRMLVVQRANEPYRGAWCEPSGRLLVGETLHDGALRELREETGLVGRVVDFCGTTESITADHHVIIHDYWVEVGSEQTPVAGDDATAVAWVSREELARVAQVPDFTEFLSHNGVLDRLC